MPQSYYFLYKVKHKLHPLDTETVNFKITTVEQFYLVLLVCRLP